VTDPIGHIPVLCNEIIELLAPKPGDVVVDCTVGRGGHAQELAAIVAPGGGRVIGLDLDPENLAFATNRLAALGLPFTPHHASYARLPEILAEEGVVADIVLADLGFASTQIDDPARGFSIQHDGPLDMRYDRSRGRSAADLLEDLEETELADLLSTLGEEPRATRIARDIAVLKASEPIRTTSELARLVKRAYGPAGDQSRLHPATRTFMALRIAVNEELSALTSFLGSLDRAARQRSWLRPGSRLGIISFHSLEDRPVKQFMASLVKNQRAVALAKGAVKPDHGEHHANPRSRSARLRAVALIEGSARKNPDSTSEPGAGVKIR
jgi:16S rRNA (cytosine1402-N4)-methyltransferase